MADPPPTDDGRPPGEGAGDFDRGVAYIEKEAYAKAIPYFDKVLEGKPDHAEAEYYRALAYARTGERAKAEKGFLRALELNGDLTLARVHLGAMYLEDPPQPEKAIAMLEAASQKEPKAPDIREQLGFAYRLVGKKDKAAQQYEASLKIKDNPDVRLGYADLLFEMGKEADSVTHLKKALPAFQKDVEKIAFIAHRLAKANAYDDCVKAFDMAIALKPKEVGFFIHRGLCKHSLKQESAARDDFEKALSIDPQFQAAHYYLAKSFMADKARGKAIEQYQKAIALDKSSAVGKKAQEELDELRKKK